MCDDGYPDIYDKKLLKTRVNHKCIECGDLVKAGDRMWRVKSLFDGHFHRHYTCLDCEAIREHICKLDPETDLCHGELIEYLQYGYLDSDYLPNVWWLQLRTNTKLKFKLANIPQRRCNLKRKSRLKIALHILSNIRK